MIVDSQDFCSAGERRTAKDRHGVVIAACCVVPARRYLHVVQPGALQHPACGVSSDTVTGTRASSARHWRWDVPGQHPGAAERVRRARPKARSCPHAARTVSTAIVAPALARLPAPDAIGDRSALRNKPAPVRPLRRGSALWSSPAGRDPLDAEPQPAWSTRLSLGLQSRARWRQARQQPEIVSVSIAVAPGYRNPLRGVSGLFPSASTRVDFAGLPVSLRDAVITNATGTSPSPRITYQLTIPPADVYVQTSPNRSGRPHVSASTVIPRSSEAMASRSDGRSQAACPRNHSFRKPGASAGLARSRPRSALTSKNCSSRWEYQPRLTAPSPLTGF